MNMITTVEKRAATQMSIGGYSKYQPVNRISLAAAPWDVQPVEAEHKRPEPVKFGAITVRTPEVARPRATSSKCVPASEEEYAIRWSALCRKEGHIQCLPRDAQARRECPAFDAYLRAALAHLLKGEDNRAGLSEAIGVADGQTVADIVRDLRSNDYLLTYKRGRFTMMSLSFLGEKGARA